MDGMRFADDLRAFLRSLASHGVEHLLVGGYAVAVHGFPRNTGDMDIWVKPTPANAERVVRAAHVALGRRVRCLPRARCHGARGRS